LDSVKPEQATNPLIPSLCLDSIQLEQATTLQFAV
jgi:hypothetical protein